MQRPGGARHRASFMGGRERYRTPSWSSPGACRGVWLRLDAVSGPLMMLPGGA